VKHFRSTGPRPEAATRARGPRHFLSAEGGALQSNEFDCQNASQRYPPVPKSARVVASNQNENEAPTSFPCSAWERRE